MYPLCVQLVAAFCKRSTVFFSKFAQPRNEEPVAEFDIGHLSKSNQKIHSEYIWIYDTNVCVCNKYIQIFTEKQYSLYFMLVTIYFHHQLCAVGFRRDRITIILSVFDKCVNISDARQRTFKCCTLTFVCTVYSCAQRSHGARFLNRDIVLEKLI